MSSVQKFMRSISIRKTKQKPKTAKKSNSTSGSSARTFANFHQEFQQQQDQQPQQQQQQQPFQVYQQQQFQDYQQQNYIPTTTPTAVVQTTNGFEYNNNNNKIYRPAPKLFIPPPPLEDFYNCGEPSEDNWTVEYITLCRQGRGLGLMVSGGVDQPADNGDTSFYVSQIVEGGVAELDGRVQLNDMIVSVNGTVFQGLTHREAVEFLVMSGETVNLVVRRPPPPAPPVPEPEEPMLTVSETIVQIHLFKGNQGLGFTVSGGVDEPIYEGDNGIFVTHIVSGGVADQEGRLTVGDRLIAVNDINLCHVRHEVAVATLKSSRDLVRLLVGKPSSPAGLPVTTSVSNMEPIDRSTPESARLAFTQSQPNLSCRAAEPLNGINNDQPITLPSPQRFEPLLQSGRPTAAVSACDLPELVPRIITDNREAASFVKEPREIVLRKKLDQGLGFNIVGGKDGHGIFVSSVVPGGIADVTGEIRRGDQLLRVNGVDLRDATHEEAVVALKTVRKRAKIVAQYRPQEFAHFERKVRDQYTRSTSQTATDSGPATAAQPRTIFIRALFDFDPSKERSMPSKGLAFSFGDILHVVRPAAAAAAAAGDAAADDDDDEWWNARRVVPWSEVDSAGLIPSKTRVERRKSHRFKNIKTMLRTESELREMLNGDKKRRSFALSKKLAINKSKDTTNDGTANGTSEFTTEAGSVHSYEPVVQLQVRYIRPIVIIGPLKDYIYDELMAEFPDKFGGCVPHTSRPKRPGELDGIDYHFVSSRDQMEQDTRKPGGQYIEVGVYNGHLYGLTANSIKTVAMQGKHCILDVTVEAIARLQSVDLYPIAILVKPATPTTMTTWDKPTSAEDSKTTFNSVQKLLNDFSKFFSAVVNAESPVQVYASVKQVIQDQSQSIIWVASGDTL